MFTLLAMLACGPSTGQTTIPADNGVELVDLADACEDWVAENGDGRIDLDAETGDDLTVYPFTVLWCDTADHTASCGSGVATLTPVEREPAQGYRLYPVWPVAQSPGDAPFDCDGYRLAAGVVHVRYWRGVE